MCHVIQYKFFPVDVKPCQHSFLPDIKTSTAKS